MCRIKIDRKIAAELGPKLRVLKLKFHDTDTVTELILIKFAHNVATILLLIIFEWYIPAIFLPVSERQAPG